ncbi:MAG: tetratricopeptide repeat-containing sensor histidine kinase [bacterium]
MKLLILFFAYNIVFSYTQIDSLIRISKSLKGKPQIEVYRNIIKTFDKQKDSTNVILWAEKLQSLTNSVSDENFKFDTYKFLSEIFCSYNSSQKAVPLLIKYLQNKNNFNDKDYKKYYNLLTDYWYYSNKFDNNAQFLSLVYVKNVKLLSEKQQVFFLKSIGYNYLQLGELDSALVYSQKSTFLREKLKDSSSLGTAYNIIGVIYWKLGVIDKAYNYYIIALGYSESTKDTSTTVLILNNLGLIFQRLKYYDYAKNYIENAMDLARKKNDLFGIGYSYKRLTDLMLDAKNLIKAEEYITLADSFFGRIKRQKDLMDIYYMYGRLYQTYNKLKTAKFYYNKALFNAFKTRDKFVEALTQTKLSEVFYSEGNYSKAIDAANEALKIAIFKKYKVIIRDNYNILYKIYKRLNNPILTLNYLEKYVEFKEKVLNENIINSINENNIRQTIHKSEDVRLRLKRENNLQKTIIANKRILEYIYIALFVLGLTGIGVITNQYLKLKSYHKTIRVNNKELIELNNQLNKKNEELITANETKNKLFSIIAHDLKNPFVSIYGFASIINEYARSKNDKELASLSDTLLYSSQKLVELIDNLAKWSRIQQNRIEPVFKTFDVVNEANDVIKQTMVNSHIKSLQLSTNMEIEALAFGDKEMIATVIRNIVSNAVKFTPENGKIEITCKLENKFIKFSVKDSGLGLPKDLTYMILTGKNISSTPGTLKEKGTGLGLTICREFIQMNNGKFSIISNPGAGAEFIVQIPAATTV